MSANPITDPELWHRATIAGRDTPGVCTVTGIERERKWDEKEGPGASGALLTFRGIKLSEPTLKIRMFVAADYDAYNDLAAYLKTFADNGGAVDFWHGSVEGLDIRSVVIVSIGAPVIVKEGDSLYEATIKLKEYRPPPKTNATKTPDGSKQGAGTGATGEQTALSAAEQEAKNLLDEARKIG
jgi:hypothetical protein